MFEPEQKSVLMVETFERDQVFHIGGRYIKRKSEPFGHSSNKSDITEFTWKSRRLCKLYLRNIVSKCVSAIHLTYPAEYPHDGGVVKMHLKRFRERLRRRGVCFFWLQEFQKRGAPHFHMVADRFVDPLWLSKTWFDCVGSGDEKHLRAGTRIEPIDDRNKIVNYFLSYLLKPGQKVVPADYIGCGRFWGYTKSLLIRKVHHFAGDIRSLFALLRLDVRRYRRRLRSWGIEWEFKQRGFVAWDHVRAGT